MKFLVVVGVVLGLIVAGIKVLLPKFKWAEQCGASFMALAKQHQGCVMRQSRLGTKLNHGGVKAFFISPIEEATWHDRSSNYGRR
ncbi:hypothetical protein Droror1_Dr00018590 [Drosera rotundifolia]